MKNYLEYKGYIGKVQFSADDMVLYGYVHGLNDLVTFEADNAVDLETAFHQSVDGYLEMCKDIDKKPEKAYKGQFNVRISPTLHKQLAYEAVKNDTTLNEETEKAIENYINGYKEVAFSPER